MQHTLAVLSDMWRHLLKPLDRIIDGISMYRLLLYYLILLLLAAIGFSAAGIIHYSPVDIVISAITLVVTCWLVNRVFASIFAAPVNPESSILTGLILALIIPPSVSGYGFLFLLAAAGLSMASKYLLTVRQKHIFNPAAIAVVLTAIGPRQTASWWVGTAALLPFVIIGGLLIMRKVRREHMVVSFVLATTIATAFLSLLSHGHLLTDMRNMLLASAVFFLGFVMLTEPYTSPTVRKWQIWYAIIVGVIMAPQFHIGNVYSTPEIALVIGNVFAYITGSKVKLFPVLRARRLIARNTAEFAFAPGQQFDYMPGQYMEFTLPHERPDNRGVRRWFSLASSPTEQSLLFGIKFYESGSSFKAAMFDMDQNTPIVAAQLAGDFVLPSDPTEKVAFIAGGIGVTPFRSMVKYLTDTKDNRPVVMLYAAAMAEDLAYRDVFEAARREIGLPTTYVLSADKSSNDRPHVINSNLSVDIIRRTVPDFLERTFYISGTHNMVESVQDMLASLGVAKHKIKIDFFPGYI